MTTILSTILAFMLSMGGSPAYVVNPSGCLEVNYNQALVEYGNGIDEQVAQEYNTKNGIFTFLPMYDSTGNMIGITDDTGKLIEKYSYSVFGMPEFDYDSAPPVIKNVTVIDGIVITGFSEPVNIGTATSGMKVKHEGTVIQGTIEPGAGGKEIKFIPTTPLQPGQISVDLAETVEDEAGNQMGSPFSNTFMYSGTPAIVHDIDPPEVDSIKKDLDGFKITFSERIDEATTTSSIEIKKTDGTISGSITTIDDRTFKFTPDEMLEANQEYTLWVYSTLKDLSGKSINQFFHSFMVLPDDFLVYEKPDPNKHVYSRIGNNYLFHGREYEPEVGLYNYRNRYYMPRIGRFLQTDPTGYLDSMNLYQSFNMNPVNFVDPFGDVNELGQGFVTKDSVEESYRNRFINAERGQRFLDYSQSIALGVGFALIAPYFEVPVIIAAVGSYMVYRGLDSYSSRRMAGQSGTQALRGGIVDAVPFGGLYYGISGRDPGTLQKIPSELRTRIMDQEMGFLTGSVIGLSFYRPSPSNFELIEAWGLTRGKVLHESVNPNGTIVRVVDPYTYSEAKALPRGAETTLTKEQVARFSGSGRERGIAFNKYLTQSHGGNSEVYVNTQLGKRVHDVGEIPINSITEMAIEGKNYLRFRKINGELIQGEVPLNNSIQTQIYKDVLWIWEGRKLGIHRIVQWEFAGAGPSSALSNALQYWGLPYVY